MDCISGISGDMFLGALFDLGLDFSAFKKEIAKLKLDNYSLELSQEMRGGIVGAYFKVKVLEKSNKARNLSMIVDLIQESTLTESIKKRSIKLFKKLAKAEGKIHGKQIEEVHFHEVGAIDSIIDIVGAVIAVEMLKIDNIYVSDIILGKGAVETLHGVIPVPAPATIELLKSHQFKFSLGKISEELLTPTGALILVEFCQSSEDLSSFSIISTGYGVGFKDLKSKPNVLRVMEIQRVSSCESLDSDRVSVLETNIDDMSPQAYEYLFERLFEAGVIDLFIYAVQMKKNRPGVCLVVILERKLLTKVSAIIFEETTSIGLRVQHVERLILRRGIKKIMTPLGEVQVKIAKQGDKIRNVMPEYEDCKKIAQQKKLPLKQVYNVVFNSLQNLDLTK